MSKYKAGEVWYVRGVSEITKKQIKLLASTLRLTQSDVITRAIDELLLRLCDEGAIPETLARLAQEYSVRHPSSGVSDAPRAEQGVRHSFAEEVAAYLAAIDSAPNKAPTEEDLEWARQREERRRRIDAIMGRTK
jgi:hypothetical protein